MSGAGAGTVVDIIIATIQHWLILLLARFHFQSFFLYQKGGRLYGSTNLNDGNAMEAGGEHFPVCEDYCIIVLL